MKKIIFKILNSLILSRGIQIHISGFNLRIPIRYYKYFDCNYELNNINFLNNYLGKNMVAIDIGAHIGLISIICSQKVGDGGKVYSFDPTPSTYEILKSTIKINKKHNIIPVMKAVSNMSGKSFFYITDIDAHNSNSLSNNKRDYGNEHKVEVQLISIDEFAEENKIPKIDLIKIDAEGAELAVLKGATKVIGNFKPKVILALHPTSIINFGNSLSEIWDFIKSENYKIYFNSEEITKEFFVSQTDLFDVFLL